MLHSKRQLEPLLAFTQRNSVKRTRVVGVCTVQEALRVSAGILYHCAALGS